MGLTDAVRREKRELGRAEAETVSVPRIGPLAFVNAFPALTFDKPLLVAAPPDGTDRLFVVEQEGRVLWMPNDRSVRSAHVALDIRDRVRDFNREEGLLGLAFHPQFKTNRQVFLYYSASDPVRNRVVRYQMDAAGNAFLAGSEQPVLEIEKPFGNHNGGMLAFGPDGCLYISVGDGGSGGDPLNNSQNRQSLLGKVLRIDVDHAAGGAAYSIPPGNPFVNDAGARPEIWAYGLRNPWRFSFDKDGTLWLGDVGQSAWEEIDVIRPGGNYGWRIREGAHPFSGEPAPRGLVEPLIEHSHAEAHSITGGIVYRGKAIPRLAGYYVYGDFITGRIWALLGGNGFVRGHEQVATAALISSFGTDAAGELYFTSYDGNIYRFE